VFAAPEVLDYVSLDSACDMWYVRHFCHHLRAFLKLCCCSSTLGIGFIKAAVRKQHHLTPTSSLSREQTLDLATGVSQLRVREFETVYPPHCGSLTLNSDSLNNF